VEFPQIPAILTIKAKFLALFDQIFIWQIFEVKAKLIKHLENYRFDHYISSMTIYLSFHNIIISENILNKESLEIVEGFS